MAALYDYAAAAYEFVAEATCRQLYSPHDISNRRPRRASGVALRRRRFYSASPTSLVGEELNIRVGIRRCSIYIAMERRR